MGRVGSKSLETALSEHVRGATLYHLHFLNDRTIERIGGALRKQYEVTGLAEMPEQFVAALHLRALLREHRRRQEIPWKIISLVRDPLARHVSAFFQYFPTNFPELGRGHLHDPANLETLRDMLVHGFRDDRDYIASWFDNEVREPFDIDVFAEPFPHERGFQISRGGLAELLVLRLEDLERTASPAVREFLDIPSLEIPRVNVGARKAYGDVYRRFRSEVPLPAWLVDEVYGSKLARHFYTEDELAGFRAAWKTS
ncbi:MAG: putative capsular polysaccharide synthesis family protein [Gemmatimonadota bacterium]